MEKENCLETRLRKIYSIREGEVENCSSDTPRCSATQIIHDPRQVRTKDELVVGGKYDSINVGASKEGKPEVLEILAIDSPMKNWIKVRVHLPYSDKTFEADRSLADAGVIPYEDGRWNAWHCLVPVEEGK